MKRLNGNSLLIIDADQNYSEKVSTYLISLGAQCTYVTSQAEAKLLFKSFDFDLVLCSYYLPDGIIHQLVDWCKCKLETMPVFVVLADIQPMDKSLMSQYTISGHFRKRENPADLLNDLENLLFDFDKFYQGIREMVEPRGIKFEMLVNNKNMEIEGIEIYEKSLLISTQAELDINSQVIVRITVFDGPVMETFLCSGFIGQSSDEGFIFNVYPNYLEAWARFLSKLDKRQFKINAFMKKVSGL